MALAAFLTATSAPSKACTLDDVDGALTRDTLNHYYPDALDVLARVVETRRAGGLPPSPGLTPSPLHIRGLMALVSRLDRQMRSSAPDGLGTPIALLLVESMLWSRLLAGPGRIAPDLHAAGPTEGDLVVVASEHAVRDVVAGKLTLAAAGSQGQLRLYGPEMARQAFMAAHGSTGSAPAPR